MKNLKINFFMVLVLIFATRSVTQAETILYGSGHVLDTGLLATHGHTLGGTFSPNDSGWVNALGGGLGAFDAILVGETGANGFLSLSATTRANIASYVSAGGRILFTGAHGIREADFMNAVFGYSVSIQSATCCENSSATLQTSNAAGPTFSDDPATISNPSLTIPIAGAPGTIMYSGSNGTYVFMDTFGAGVVGYLAWDFCCGSTAEIERWYQILDSALTFISEPAVIKELTAGPEVVQLNFCN